MRFAQEISIFNPFAIEKKVIELGTTITQTARAIELRADELYAEKGAVTDLSSRLTVMAGEISSEVTARQDADNILSSNIRQTAHTISLSVSGKAGKSSGAGITITLKDADGNTLSSGSGNVLIDGNVVFKSDLSTVGSTTINGSNIHSGTIKLGGASNGNGQLYVYDASNNEIGHWNNTGIYIKNGEIYQEKYVDSDVKNAWLRIQSTEITGGYTGLNHTAMVDLQDWQWVTDTGTGQQRKEGVLNLKCTNGSVAITPDHGVYIQAPKEINALSEAGVVIGHTDLSTGQLDVAVAVAPGGLALVTNNNGIIINGNRTYTQYNTNFAPTGEGVGRHCDIINGLICNMRWDS